MWLPTDFVSLFSRSGAGLESQRKDSKKRKDAETPRDPGGGKGKKGKGYTSNGQLPSQIACVGRKLIIIDDGTKYPAFMTTGQDKRWEIKYYGGVGTADAQIEVASRKSLQTRYSIVYNCITKRAHISPHACLLL